VESGVLLLQRHPAPIQSLPPHCDRSSGNATSSTASAAAQLQLQSLSDVSPPLWLPLTAPAGITVKSTLHLVDLAGCEQLKQSGAEGQRMREAININSSLLVLGRCVGGLTALSCCLPPAGRKEHAYHRERCTNGGAYVCARPCFL
jgi:hypothetical protein